MNKKKKLIIISVVVLLVVAALAVTGILLWLKGDNSGDNSPLAIDLVDIIPAAYVGEDYDLRQIIEMEDGVEYSAMAAYQNYNSMEEIELTVTDLVFCQNEQFDVYVLITATRGEETARKAAQIPVVVRLPMPENPPAVKEDGDLISGSFTADEVTDGISGIMKVAQDDEGNAKSNSMLLSWANTSDAFPKATFMFDEVQDWSEMTYLTFDTKVVNAHPWMFVEIISLDRWDKPVYSTYCVLNVNTPGWYTNHVLINQFSNVDLSKVCGLRFCVNMQDKLIPGKLGQFYIDNVNIIQKSKDDGDLLADAVLEWGAYHDLTSRGGIDGYVYEGYCEDTVSGNVSTRSKKFTVEANQGGKWAKAQMRLSAPMDMTNKILMFDIKLVNAYPWMDVKLEDSNWIPSGYWCNNLKPTTDWQTVIIDTAAFSGEGDLSDTYLITFGVNDDENKQLEQIFYIDNLRVVDKEKNDLLATTTYQWHNSGPYFSYDLYSPVVSKDSWRSLAFRAAAGGTGWPYIQFMLSNAQDLSNYVLTYDVKFVNALPQMGLKLHDSKWNDIAIRIIDVTSEADAQGWQKVELDLRSLFAGCDLTDVLLFSFGYNFDFHTDKNRTVYIDNVRLTLADPLPMPENPPAVKEDGDLISGSFTTAEVTDGISGIMKVAQDDEGNARSNSMLLLWANMPSAYPKATFMFDEVQDWSEMTDLSFDTKVVNAHHWMSVELISYDANGELVYSTVGALNVKTPGWHTNHVLLRHFSNVDLSKICGLRFCVDMQNNLIADKIGQFYIDNVNVTKDDGDLLADAVLEWGEYHDSADWGGADGYSHDRYCEDTVSGEESTRSWKFTVEADKGGKWGKAQIRLATPMDMTNKILMFDIKLVNAYPWMDVKLEDSNWIPSGYWCNNLKPTTDWQTVIIDTAAFSGEGDLSNTYLITFGVNDDENKQLEQIFYIDNLRVVDKEKNDLLATTTYQWHNSGPYFSYDLYSPVVSKDSWRSLAFRAAAGGTGMPYIQFMLSNAQDLSNCVLTYDVKFENAQPQMGLKLHGSSWNDIAVRIIDVTSEADAQGWQKVELDLESLFAGCDLTDVLLFSFGYNFDFHTDKDRTVYIDNVQLIPKASTAAE